MKSKDLKPTLLNPAKLSFRMEGQIKCFPDKVKLKEFIITKPLYFLKDFIYLFLERGEGKEKERERNINVRLALTHLPRDQACALTGNQTNDPLVRRPVLNPLSYTSQGCFQFSNCGPVVLYLRSFFPWKCVE